MPTFAGVSHLALSVTDLDRSTRFYTEVLGLLVALDFGHGRICLDRTTGLTVGLIAHPGGATGPFSELQPGLDHLGFAAADRDALVVWQEHFERLGVPHSPIQDTDLGHHLNFRDPDGIALELDAPTDTYRALLAQIQDPSVSVDELRDHAEAVLGPGLVARS
jgi:glyoxylase I family protein